MSDLVWRSSSRNMSDSRQGLNKQFTLADLLRQSVYVEHAVKTEIPVTVGSPKRLASLRETGGLDRLRDRAFRLPFADESSISTKMIEKICEACQDPAIPCARIHSIVGQSDE